MGWKGAVRSIGAAVRAAERDAKKRQRELQRLNKQYEKMQELEQAAYEVELYENSIEIIQSVHKECGERINWKEISASPEPDKPENTKKHESAAIFAANSYKPGLIDRILKRENKIRQKLKNDTVTAIEKDTLEYNTRLSDWEKQVVDWKESVDLAKLLLDGDGEAKLQTIKELDPFSEISTLGSNLSFSIDDKGTVEATIHIHGDDIVPKEIKSLLKSGKLSVKKMPTIQFNEFYQDYVCSCVLRVANELFSILPDDAVVVTAIDELLNTTTGHLDRAPILSAYISRNTLMSLKMDSIDPSDSMGNFIHNMSFKKTKGFESVTRVEHP
jgi:hypothetical protein